MTLTTFNCKTIITLSFTFTLLCVCHKTLCLDKWEVGVPNSPSGMFDFYVYAVTWQPSFCKINDINGCPNDFKLHGLWPYFKTPHSMHIKNYHPEACLFAPGCNSSSACELTDSVIVELLKNQRLKDILPFQPSQLMKHEWLKHGTCSGLNPFDYFFLAIKIHDQINLEKLNTLIKQHDKTKPLHRKAVLSTLPAASSLWCKQHKNIPYLYEVHFFIDKHGNAYNDTDTQIGMPCPEFFYIP